MNAIESLTHDADALADDLTAWRREIHRRPELGFEEVETAALVEGRLRDLSLDEIRTGIAGTGVVGVLRAPRTERAAVLLRADMDALPIQEVEGRTYGSRVPGRMHACGHDGHTSMLLGAATLLARHRTALRNDVVFCFQPAEEGQGGARRMIEHGVLEEPKVGRAFGLHLWTPFPAGTVHVRSGALMAAQDEFHCEIHGRGGHGAAPHQGRDPLLAASLAVVGLQTVVARSVDPVEPAVVHVGCLQAGEAPNVMPDRAVLNGTLRSFSTPVRELLRDRVRSIVDTTAAAQGCRAEFRLLEGYPAVVNTPEEVRLLRSAAAAVVGYDRVVETPPMAASEDFAYYLERVPGAFAFLGAGNESRGIVAPHHSPEFDIEESVLPRGAELLARLGLGPRASEPR